MLTSVYFHPSQNTLTRYANDGGFTRDETLAIDSLTSDQQAAVAAAVALALSLLPAGFAAVTQMIVEKRPDVVLTWTTLPDPTVAPTPLTTSPTFHVTVTGVDANGHEGTVPIDSVPGTQTSNLQALWAALDE